jgi:hypothetical protein
MNSSASETKFINIGGIKVSRASFFILITGAIISLILAIFLPFPYSIIISVLVLLFSIMNAYTINCAQVGHCKIWAWILTSVFVVYLCIYSAILLINKDKIFNIPKINAKVNAPKVNAPLPPRA